MAIDWEAKVGAPTVAVFGGLAMYYPAGGGAPFTINGVFDEGYREVTIIDGLSYTSDATPVIGVNVAQFGLYGVTPAQNDRVLIMDPLSPAFNKTFIVKEPRPDSHGITRLVMQETPE